MFDLGKEAEALECFNKAALIVESGKFDSYTTEASKNYINRVLTEDRAKLIKKLTEFASAEVETLHTGPVMMVTGIEYDNPLLN